MIAISSSQCILIWRRNFFYIATDHQIQNEPSQANTKFGKRKKFKMESANICIHLTNSKLMLHKSQNRWNKKVVFHYQADMQKRVKVKTKKLASKAANIFRRCLKLGIMSKSLDDKTFIDRRFPTTPKIPSSGVKMPSMKNLMDMTKLSEKSVSPG